ncbi:hypothetical protein HPP92_007823 [Vanilla planifolia]|uniref:Uncharacterized protein n=1 Tax=Vanilla planifolia TaxID=51239 RepID=A0A835RN52_VANPL|nr:hypothetical protein HPP92_007823 [Vanilla planifolia]
MWKPRLRLRRIRRRAPTAAGWIPHVSHLGGIRAQQGPRGLVQERIRADARQGRRWGGFIRDKWNFKRTCPYKGLSTMPNYFESYGVPHGSQDLAKAVPDHHRKFLADLVWLHEEDSVWIDHSEGRICCKLIAVHAGLEKSKSVDEQLKFLKAKDTSIPKVEDLSGRHNVWEIPQVSQDS